MHTSNQLSGKRVILLGASSGLGLATAKAAAAEGAKVVIVSGNRQRIDQALKELPAGSEGYPVDLGKEENSRDFFHHIGRFDHLVYSAGENLTLNLIGETDIDKARQFFNLRFWGAFTAVKYGAPHINPGGSVSLTSGNASIRPGKGWTIAAGICGAMEGLVRALAVELSPIRVNSVMPGVVRSNLWNSMPAADRENLFKAIGEANLVHRVGEVEDIALAFVYLMKQQYGTGQNLVIDGGSVLA
jgi:NAD(P)-dependent dehydrogenase (short-subunit alcohol dehydrogenase family)